MKRLALFFIALCLLYSCGNKHVPTDSTIKYDGNKTLDIVLLEELDLKATSELDLTYYSDNELVVTVTNDGIVKGKNIGEANVTISNSETSIVVKVIVSLFEEPTFQFGISQNEIKEIYGVPNHNFGDTILIYGSGNDWYSYAVWEMDFFFINNQYVESDLYIRSDVEPRLNEFLNNNYFFNNQYNDTIDDEPITYDIYLNDEKPEDATILLGKINEAGSYDDICLFYVPFEYEGKYDYKPIVKRMIDKR